jgi:hypothetical protein
MCIRNKIIKEYNEGKTVEELADEYGDMSCMAEEFDCEYPPRCNDNGDYCENCWINKVEEIVEE